ncbi:ROK family protein [Pedobacter sp. Du54]|uniref:ROK family protein n=1 Tax=Pedobacter anseongensis TaxID=3133439 RepID=UPI00309DB429
MSTLTKKTSKLHYDLIHELYYRKSSSCNQLSLATKKSIPLVTKVVNELIDMDYVIEEGYAPSSGGRRPLMYSLVKDKLFMVVVAMDQLSTRIGIVDLHNDYILPLAVVELKLQNNKTALSELTQHLKDYIKKSNISSHKFIGIGIGMPGFINVSKGINYTYLETNKKTLKQHLLDELGIPAFIDNDSSLITLAELKFGAAKSTLDAMVINMGWGIGLGMIINGSLFRGHNGFSGEIGHIPISEENILCSCGKQGCLEAVASLLAVAEKAIIGIKEGRVSSLAYIETLNSTVEVGNAVLKEANKGDQYAIELISDAAYKIGRGLSILIHIMNPKVIVLSGRGVKVAKLMLAPIQQALNKYCIPRLFADTDIKVSKLGFDAELIGASILVMQNFGKERDFFSSIAKS